MISAAHPKKVSLSNHALIFSELDLAAMERALNRETPDDDLRDELNFLLPILVDEKRQGELNLNQKRDALHRAERAAVDLAKKLRVDALLSDQSFYQNLWQGEKIEDLVDFEDAANSVALLSESIAKLLNRIGRRKKEGRPADSRRGRLVITLSDLEEKYTGKRTIYTLDVDTGKHRGPLFLLVRTFEHEIAQKFCEVPPEDGEIAGSIRRTLSKDKTS